MEKLSFKQYLESKEKLREAVKKNPIHKVTYSMRKYCKLPVGNSKDTKKFIPLKPKNKVIVEWDYEDINKPVIRSLCFENVKGVTSTDKFKAFWSDQRLQKWLLNNTEEL